MRLGFSSPLIVERVSLWATLALHLWGVQVIGLAASRQGMCGDGQQLEEEFWLECV